MLILARVFSDGMTLQREKDIRLFGQCDPAQNVSVLINGTQVATASLPQGNFELILPPQPAMEDATLVLRGEHDMLELRRVDIGEVWVAGGQSNMEYLLRKDAEGADLIAAANDSHLRFYDVGEYAFEGEEKEGFKDNSGWDRWMNFAPETAGYFSAVGCYFALDLRKTLGVPVAIVGCNWGGTTASAWLAESYLQERPELRVYLDEYRKKTAKTDPERYEKHAYAGRALHAIPAVRRVLDGEGSAADWVRVAALMPRFLRGMLMAGPKSYVRPAGLYEMMVKQIAGFSCRGVIWYQGESDDVHADIYDSLFSAVIRCWRDSWQDELPFLFVQLAPFGRWLNSGGDLYPTVREKQDWVSKNVPSAHMASIMDSGMQKDIHPKHKRPVGERLALLARGKVYGETVLCEAPEPVSHEVTEGTLRLTFAHAGDGLFIKDAPLRALELSVDGKAIATFDAVAADDTLTVSCADIHSGSQVSVAFAWVAYCEVNLYNSAGLPARPFRI